MAENDNMAHIMAGQISQAADLISKHTNTNKEKIEFFIKEFGIEKLFNEPQLIGLTDDQTEKLIELKTLIDMMGR